MRTQAGAEGAADVGGTDPYLVGGQAEDLLQVGLAVLRPLGLVVHQQAAVGLDDDRGRVRFHGIVVLDRRAVAGLDPNRRGAVGGVEIAALGGQLGGSLMGLVEGGQQVGLVRLGLDIDAQQRARVAGQFQAPCQDQGKGLAAVQDAVVEQRAEGFAFGGIGVLVGLVVARHRRPVQVIQYRDHPGYRQGRRTVYAAHPAAGDVAADHAAVEQVGGRIFGGVASLAGDLGWPVDAIQGLPGAVWQAAHWPIPPEWASSSARTMALRANPILKALWASGLASRSSASAKRT